MRKVVAGLFHSVDGVVEAPNEFQFDSFDTELGEELGAVMGNVSTVVMGRVGYQEWAGYWTNASQDLDFAGFINGVEKFVASETLQPSEVTWSNAHLIEGDFLDFVRALKSGEGGDICAMGGISLVRQLVFAGLMDELTLITHPVIAGKGRHLFEPGDPTTRLELIRARTTSKGNVVQVYRRLA
ncbi:deaminase/reductase [Devosia riboflavina]|uniref:Deaminase/reductase n=1 Tax=Devosia riboflavina TaxID=46914 RepID=A0A087LZY3_9HYPH|nr:dihydrofolate reductase family protein [Devosia riboflavina]KFL30186.1 deaminase/reductase [Devosia riboflavina]